MKNSSVAIEKAIENGVLEVVLREGKAVEILPEKNVLIEGAIDSPSRFLKSRDGQFNQLKSHAIVNRDERTINLVINENEEFGNYKIVGSIKLSDEFEKTGINTNKAYSPKELSKFFKLKRNWFQSPGEHAKIVAVLKNIEAKINREFEEKDDGRANTSRTFNETVESNVPSEFTLIMPVIKGEKKVEFPVAVELEVRNGEIYCTLESILASELIDKITEERIDEEVKKITSLTTVIEQ